MEPQKRYALAAALIRLQMPLTHSTIPHLMRTGRFRLEVKLEYLAGVIIFAR